VIGIFAAGSFAGELQNGQLRTVSLRSVPRLSIVLAKFISLSVYSYALISITAMFLMFSVIFRKMTMAVVVPLGIYFTSYILGVLPFMENIQRFLPTRYIMIWKYAMAQDIMWDSMMTDGLFLALYTVCYLVIAAVVMNTSDL
jgi:ABC-type transport system involved in multi-copper enzyme maturation permease subunit